MNTLPPINQKYIQTENQIPRKQIKIKTCNSKLKSLKNYDIAINYYSKNLKQNKENTLYLTKRAICYLAKGYYTLALKDALESIELDKTSSKGYYIAALSYLEMNDIENAEKYIFEKKTNNKNNILPKVEQECQIKHNNQRLLYLYEKTKKELQNKCSKYKLYSKYLYFLKELYKYDSFFPKLEIQFYSEDSRGVVAKSPVKKDEIIMIIPKTCLISLETAKDTVIGSKIYKFMYQELNSPKHCLLSSYILSEENNQKWKFYFDLFPKDFSNFPIFFKEKELELLKGSSFLQQIFEKKIEMKRDYEKICEYIPEFTKYSFAKFVKARLLIASRIFGITIDNISTDVLAPFADLLNHKRPRQTQWYFDNNLNAFVIQAMTDINKGEEIFDSYGQKTNSRFLLSYGFCLEDNDFNEYQFTLCFNENVPLYQEKKQFLQTEDYSKRFKLVDSIYESELFELISFLRFLLFDEDFNVLYNSMSTNQNFFYEETSQTFYYVAPISSKLEINVLKYLHVLCREALNKFPTTIEQDRDNIKNNQLDFNTKNCILLLISEKTVLNFYIKFCEYCLFLFKLTEEQIIQKVNDDFKNTDCQFELYIQEVIMKLIKAQ